MQQALLLPESEGGNPALIQRTLGTVFIGTPHPGAFLKHVETPASIRDYITFPSGQEIACLSEEQLEQAREPIAMIGVAFRQADPIYWIINFCLGTSSICPGASEIHPNCLWSLFSRSQQSRREESHYFLSESLDPIAARTTVEHSIACMSDAATRSLEDFYRCLESEEVMKDRYAKYRAKSTCDWLFSLDMYDQWVSANDAPLLWIRGSPGTGKSTLCSAIIDDLGQHAQLRDVIAFTFLDDSRDRFDAAQYILRTLEHQLREHQPSVIHEFVSHVIPRESENISRHILREDFQLELRRILASVEREARIFVILDGLDRDEWIKEVLIGEIGEANLSRKSPNKIRCAIATQDLLEVSPNHVRVTSLNLDIEPGVRHDIQTFITGGLADMAAKYATHRASTVNLATRLCCRADGVFLWAALVLEGLDQKEIFADLAMAIESIPATVDGIYREELRAIPSHNVEAAQKILSWVTAASRPLRLSELEEALAVETDFSVLSAHGAGPVAKFESQSSQRDISRLCGRLVTIAESGVVRLRHPSLRTYLLFTGRSSRAPRYPLLEAHELIARSCLALLNPIAKKNASILGIKSSFSETAETNSSLTDYAAANWSLHYRLAETYSRLLAGTLQGCLVLTLNHACDYLNLSPSGRSIQIANATLRISASHGLVSLTRMCLEMGTDPEAGSCTHCKTPFALAAAGGHREAANVLLMHAISSASQARYDAEKMLQLAVAGGLTDIAKTLLRLGAEVGGVDRGSGRTLLHDAAASGNWKLVRLLMDYNADVNAVVPITLETPLHLAALHGHLQAVRYLVDGRNASAKEVETYESIVQQPYYQSWTDDLLSEDGEAGPLVWEVGARDSAENHLEKLLSWSGRYSFINRRTVGALTALDLAASRGHEHIVRFLLERGATLQKAKSAPYTALQAAAENGHMATVKLLLAAGADRHQRSEKLGATLKHASENGYNDVADLLLWHYFKVEIFGHENFQWPVLCVPTKSHHTVVRDSIQKTRGNKNLTKSTTQPRAFARVSSKLAERPRVEPRA